MRRVLVMGPPGSGKSTPEGCLERFNLEFLRYTWNWNRTKRARALRLVEDFSGRKIVLHGVRQQLQFSKAMLGRETTA